MPAKLERGVSVERSVRQPASPQGIDRAVVRVCLIVIAFEARDLFECRRGVRVG